MRRYALRVVVAVLADPGVDSVVGQRFRRQYRRRPGDRSGDHRAAAAAAGADRGPGSPAAVAAALIAQVAYYWCCPRGRWRGWRSRPDRRRSMRCCGRLAVKSDLVLALAANIITLIPGSIVLEIDQDRELLYMHVIDVGSDRSVDRFYRQVAEIERLLVASFERDTPTGGRRKGRSATA